MLALILKFAGRLLTIAAELATGKISEDEARAQCLAVGTSITETDSDAELTEFEKLMEAKKG